MTNPDINHLLSSRSWCYTIPDQDPTVHGGYVPSISIEYVAGHIPMTGRGSDQAPWVCGKTFDEAVGVCQHENELMGIDAMTCAKIVASTFRTPKLPHVDDSWCYLTRASKGLRLVGSPVEGFYEVDEPQIQSGEVWQLDVGHECNIVLNQADFLQGLNANADHPDVIAAEAMRSLVTRVAEFEDLNLDYNAACNG